MNWLDFGPYVNPYVPGVPAPTLVHHVRLAAIEFCLETKCWVRNLEPMQSGADGLIDIEPESNRARIFDIQRIAVSGIEWPLVTASLGVARRDLRDDADVAFTDDLQVLAINPIPKAGSVVDLRVAMTLKEDAVDLPRELNQYVQRITHGALASLMRIPGQPFTSPESERHEAIFRGHIKQESSRLARGQVASGHGRINPSFM
jgi:hypothetical protein